MRLTILGCNGPFPQANGACSGYLLEHENTRVLLDCGTGVLARLIVLTEPAALDAVVLTHLHYDHMSDILPLSYRCFTQGKKLNVYLPMQENPLRTLLQEDFALHDLAAGGQLGALTLTALPVRHPVPAYAVRLCDAAGKALCYTGDTNTRPGLEAFAQGVDLLLADGCFSKAQWDAQKPHLSAHLAAELARDAQAKRLVLTHFRPDSDRALLLSEAREAYPAAELADFDRIFDF